MITIEENVICSECQQTRQGVTFLQPNKADPRRLSVCLDCLIEAVRIGKDNDNEKEFSD